MNYDEIRRLLRDCSNALDCSANMIGTEDEIMKYIDGLKHSELNGFSCPNAQGKEGKDAFELVCEERNKLQNNWNELKKWLEEEIKDYRKKEWFPVAGHLKEVLDKMQELEQGKDE